MFQNPTFIKAMSIIALVLFILAMICGILLTVTGALAVSSTDGFVDSSLDNVSPDDPGAGWLFLGQFFGGSIAAFASFLVLAFGIICIIGDLIIYLPAFIAHLVYKRSKNVTAYWILMGVWLALLLICLCMILFG